jgi:hypothetical protein
VPAGRITSIQQGNLGEAAFLHKATSLGFVVASPSGSGHPYDFIVKSGRHLWLAQVKVCGYQNNGFYEVAVRRSNAGGLHPYLESEIDFVVVYIIPEDRWYVVPVREVVGRTNLYFRAANTIHKSDPYAQYLDAWGQTTKPDGLVFG